MAAAVFCAACATTRPSANAPLAPSTTEAAFLSGDWDRAIRDLEPLLNRPARPDTAPRLVLLGRCCLGAGRYADAERAFRHAKTGSPDPDTAAGIEDGLGRAAFALSRWADAADAFGRLFAMTMTARGHAVAEDDALYLRALSCARAGRWDEAAAALDTIAALYADSPHAVPAALRRPVVQRRTHYVQIGSFEEPSGAERLRDHAAQLGFPSEIVTASTATQTYHVVLLGPYETHEAADDGEARARAAGLEAIAVP